MLDKLKQILGDKRIALLGFGLEGQSSFRFFSKHFPEHHFLIADQNTELQNHTLLQGENISFSLGKSYLDQVSIKDFIIK